MMDISNSTVKGKLSKAPETRIFYLWAKCLQFRMAACFSIISKAECSFTMLNLGLPVNPAEIELSLLISRLQK